MGNENICWGIGCGCFVGSRFSGVLNYDCKCFFWCKFVFFWCLVVVFVNGDYGIVLWILLAVVCIVYGVCIGIEEVDLVICV